MRFRHWRKVAETIGRDGKFLHCSFLSTQPGPTHLPTAQSLTASGLHPLLSVTPPAMSIKAAINKLTPGSIDIPRSNGHPTPDAAGKRTPKTPQDEALAFFSTKGHEGEPVQVWELWLDDDGGPGESKSVRRPFEGLTNCPVHPPPSPYSTLRLEAFFTARYAVYAKRCAQERLSNGRRSVQARRLEGEETPFGR